MQAVTTCESAFEATADPRAGAAAARALYKLERYDEVTPWLERLGGTVAEPDLLSLTGHIERRRGDPDKSIDSFTRAAEVYRAAGNPGEASRAAYAVFYVAWEAARYRQAFEAAGQAYADAEEAGDQQRQATALTGLATVFFEVGDLDAAERANRAATRLTPPERRTDRGRFLALEGLIQLRRGRPELARAAFEEALTLADDSAETGFFRRAHLNLVDACLRLGDLEAALQHLERAAAFAEADPSATRGLHYYRARAHLARGEPRQAEAELEAALAQDPDPAWAWRLLVTRGAAREALRLPAAAEQDYRRASQILEDHRADLGFDQLKAWLLSEWRRPFEALARLQASGGRAEEAFATVERAKARTFVDAFVQAARSDAGAAPISSLTALAADRTDALGELLPALTTSSVTDVRPHAQLVELIRHRPVLAYFQAEQGLWLFFSRNGVVEARLLDASVDEMGVLVDRYRANLDDSEVASTLGELLLPAELALPAGGRLEIVTDGVLGSLPFAALRRNGRFLVEEHTLAYAPSLNALAVLLEVQRHATGPALVLGDPLRDLPAAAEEAVDVARFLGVTPRTGPAAGRDALREASEAVVLHLATHTGLGPRGPWLLLADGQLHAGDVLRDRLGAELVVLASCVSAAREGKGLWGSLGAAFLAAGSRAVVASLWSVDDTATRDFVARFYQHGGRDDPAMALARAQRASIDAGAPASVWASFVVFGPNQPLSGS